MELMDLDIISTETKKRTLVEAIQSDDEFMSEFKLKYDFNLKYTVMKQHIKENHPEIRPSSNNFFRDCFHDLLLFQCGEQQVPRFIQNQINMGFLKPCTLDVVALNTANSLVLYNIEQFENSFDIHTMPTHELVPFLVDKCLTFPTEYARQLFDRMTVFEKLAYLAHVLLPERGTMIKKFNLPLDYYVKKMATVVMRGVDCDHAWDWIINEYKSLMRTKMQSLELSKLPLFQQAYNLAEDFVRDNNDDSDYSESDEED